MNVDLTVQAGADEEDDVLHLSLTLNQTFALVSAFDDVTAEPLWEQLRLEGSVKS